MHDYANLGGSLQMRALPGNGKWWMDADEDTGIRKRGMDKGERREKKGKRQKKIGEREEIKHWGSGTRVVYFFFKENIKSEDLRPVPKQLEDQLSWNGGLSTQLGPEVMVQS